MSEDYKKDLSIDFHNLHVCYRDHAANLMEWSERWANAEMEKNQRKKFLRKRIREDPEEWGLPSKPSVAAVTARMDEDDELIRLRHDVNVFLSAKDAFYQRSKALDGLRSLYMNGYFTVPNPEGMSQVKEEKSERVRRQQQEALESNPRMRRGRDGSEDESKDETTEGGPR
jgi:hypothetical protein